MASHPNGGEPVAPGERPDEPTAAQPPAPSPGPPPPVSALHPTPAPGPAADGGAPQDKAMSWWRSKKVLRPAVLAVIGVAFLLGGFAMYSSPGELSTPSFATIQLKSTFPVGSILYDVSQSQASPDTAKVTIYVQLPSNVLRTPAKAPAAGLWLELPPGTAFESCPPAACRFDQNEKAYTWYQALDFKYEDTDSKSGEALATFPVKASGFGYVFNDINAAAAMPRVVFLGPGSATPILYTEYYNVTSPNSYDWSALQPQLTNANEILWDEPVAGGTAPGIAAVGIDYANESKDNFKTFVAGALLGLAGGALLAAVQEALHPDD